jgi:hypothetical protein
LCRRSLRPSAIRIGRQATIIRTSLTYPVRGATNRAKCILIGFPETKSSLPASFLNGKNQEVDLNAGRKASASLPAFQNAVDPYQPGDGPLALPFLGEIHLIARIRLDGFVRTLCQRCRWDRDQEGEEDNETEHAHVTCFLTNFGLYCIYQINLTRLGAVFG